MAARGARGDQGLDLLGCEARSLQNLIGVLADGGAGRAMLGLPSDIRKGATGTLWVPVRPSGAGVS